MVCGILLWQPEQTNKPALLTCLRAGSPPVGVGLKCVTTIWFSSFSHLGCQKSGQWRPLMSLYVGRRHWKITHQQLSNTLVSLKVWPQALTLVWLSEESGLPRYRLLDTRSWLSLIRCVPQHFHEPVFWLIWLKSLKSQAPMTCCPIAKPTCQQRQDPLEKRENGWEGVDEFIKSFIAEVKSCNPLLII